MADANPMVRMEGKLIHLSNDGRVVAFEAVIEAGGECITIDCMAAEEAEALRTLVGERVVVTIASAVAPPERSVFLVPGVMRCAKCEFQLTRTNLYVRRGTTGPGDSKTEPCPNGCGPLWPVTWQQWAEEAWAYAESLRLQLEQTPPVSNTTTQLIDMLRQRDARGLKEYGVTLDRGDLSLADWLQHQAEELLDGAGYALAAIRKLREAEQGHGEG